MASLNRSCLLLLLLLLFVFFSFGVSSSISAIAESTRSDCKQLRYLMRRWNMQDSVNLSDCCTGIVELASSAPAPAMAISCDNSSITELDLSNLNLTRTLSELNLLSDFSQLIRLDLSRNRFNGSLQLWTSWPPKLAFLNLSFNHLQAAQEKSLISPILRVLDLSGNMNLTEVGDICNGFPNLERLNLTNTGVTNYTSAVNHCAKLLRPPSTEIFSHGRKLKPGLIAGIVLGIVIVLAHAVLLVVWLIFRRRNQQKRRRRHHQSAWAASRKPLSLEITSKMDLTSYSLPTDSPAWMADVKDPTSIVVTLFEKPLLNLTLADLMKATSSFSKEAEIEDEEEIEADGSGGDKNSNVIYKCELPGILPEGMEVVIKRVSGREVVRSQSKAESAEAFSALGKLRHENLVPFLGFCIVGEERLLLYKSMPRGSLYDWLHSLPQGTLNSEDWSMDTWEKDEEVAIGGGGSEEEEKMGWQTRLKIGLDIARALAFLHHGCSPRQIVHGDISSKSIHLDEGFEPHLSYRGLNSNSLLVLKKGRNGYTPPEYYTCNSGQGDVKTKEGDVFSFGVVLFELVSGKRAIGDHYPGKGNSSTLVEWVRWLMKEKNGLEAVDPRLTRRGDGNKMLEMLRIGYYCTAENASMRLPMQQVKGLLKEILHSSPNP